ncbi:MAG: YceI family protein [Cellvibrionaceae bacterium]
MKKTLLTLLTAGSIFALSTNIYAADYIIDTKGAHASINFKIMHAGFSWLTGRFNSFDGNFSYDKDNIEAANIKVNIDTSSIDSNHAKRDKHLRSDDFLEVDKYPVASFVSKKIIDKGDGKIDIMGDLTLHGVTRSITIDAKRIAEGDRKGKYLAGFAGTTELVLKDFNIKRSLGPASTSVYMDLHIEGIRQ